MIIPALMVMGCQERETQDRVVVQGYYGAARKNPYLAAERYLKANGVQVVSQSGVVEMDYTNDVVFAPASTLRSTGDVERVLNWVSNGGNYICFLARGEDYWRDVGGQAAHDPGAWYEVDIDGKKTAAFEQFVDRVGYRLGDLDVTHYTESDSGEDEWLAIQRGKELPNAVLTEVEVGGEKYGMRLGGMKGVARLGDPRGEVMRFASTQYGSGSITFISDARALRNPYLGMEDHAEVLDALVRNYAYSGKVVFSLGKVPKFTALLGEYAWRAMVALAVLLALWLWKNLPRFGPVMEVEDSHQRSYAEHLLNTGNFLWEHEQPECLLKPFREEIRRKAGRIQEDLGAEADWFAELAAESGLSAEQVSEAMSLSKTKDAGQMVRVTRNLQIIYKSL